jgi:hypothetical protein
MSPYCNLRLRTIYSRIGWTTAAINTLRLCLIFRPHQQRTSATAAASTLWSYTDARIVSVTKSCALAACCRNTGVCRLIESLAGMDVTGKTTRYIDLAWFFILGTLESRATKLRPTSNCSLVIHRGSIM